jgi:GH15 family glucan-1,4-alpha-glucosidase
MYKKISDYGIIGNLHTVALVGLDGSMDWLCLPYIDSPSVFGALLDHKKGGRFQVRPRGEWDSTAEYLPGTNVLVTRFRTRTGVLRVTDFMPVLLEEGRGGGHHSLYRLVEATEGTVEAEVLFEPRFDYARAETGLGFHRGGILAKGGGEQVGLSATRELEIEGRRGVARWGLARGERAWLQLRYGAGELCVCELEEAEQALRDTEHYWRDWLEKSETGRVVELGPYRETAERSALVLKLLYYAPTGALAAAATTSLPEEIGGVRNWDYRFTWVRDASFTLQALFNTGHLSETEGYLRWVEGLLSGSGPHELKILYSLRGEVVDEEEELAHLEGYKGSRPVRVGNGAALQRQLDIFGELMEAALKLSNYVGKIDLGLWPFLRGICDYVCEHWHEPDYGIWEVRGGPYHFVYSRVMCWVALDRGITIAGRYGFPADVEKWRAGRDEIKEEVLAKGWDGEKKSFVQRYGADALDSSGLLIPATGFLPHDDPRVVSTVEAVRRELGRGDFLFRYTAADGLPGGEGAFLLCAFWLIDNLVARGELDEAEALLGRMESAANHLGLFSEEYDPDWREALGNFPQAFTHIGYINSVTALRQGRQAREQEPPRRARPGLFSRSMVLNEGAFRPGDVTPHELARRLKDLMNVMRGAFFETHRVAYERMRTSRVYREYVELSRVLGGMDPCKLRGREERIAFWINIYNVLVIHGVVEMGIRDSVKEVRNFFKRVKYRVGDMLLSPEDIEHGVLRANRRPPGSLSRKFRRGDSRLACSLDAMEPRVHFALVCASSSCPPIGVYTAENLDGELDIAARTFLNAGGVELDKEAGRVSLSRVFKWYGGDFGKDAAPVLRFIAPYLYMEEDRTFLLENASRLGVSYQDYDWRLNRY